MKNNNTWKRKKMEGDGRGRKEGEKEGRSREGKEGEGKEGEGEKEGKGTKALVTFANSVLAHRLPVCFWGSY